MSLATQPVHFGNALKEIIVQGHLTLMILRSSVVEKAKKKELRKILKSIRRRIRLEGAEILYEQEIVLAKDCLREFYREHEEKPFFEDLMDATAGRCIVFLIYKKDGNVIELVRNCLGDTMNPSAGTFRYMCGKYNHKGCNSGHGSDSNNSFFREIKIIFPDGLPSEFLVKLSNFIF